MRTYAEKLTRAPVSVLKNLDPARRKLLYPAFVKSAEKIFKYEKGAVVPENTVLYRVWLWPVGAPCAEINTLNGREALANARMLAEKLSHKYLKNAECAKSAAV